MEQGIFFPPRQMRLACEPHLLSPCLKVGQHSDQSKKRERQRGKKMRDGSVGGGGTWHYVNIIADLILESALSDSSWKMEVTISCIILFRSTVAAFIRAHSFIQFFIPLHITEPNSMLLTYRYSTVHSSAQISALAHLYQRCQTQLIWRPLEVECGWGWYHWSTLNLQNEQFFNVNAPSEHERLYCPSTWRYSRITFQPSEVSQ